MSWIWNKLEENHEKSHKGLLNRSYLFNKCVLLDVIFELTSKLFMEFKKIKVLL